MALQKTKQIKGYDTNYWRIIQLNSNFDRSDAVITLALYKDKATRTAEPGAILETIAFDLGEDFANDIYDGRADKVRSIKLKEAYKILKIKSQEVDSEMAFFADAVEV